MKAIDYKEVSAYLKYNPETGVITNKISRHNAEEGAIASKGGRIGYLQVHLNMRKYQAHRVAWVLHTGKDIPKGMTIDHINNDRADNRIDNLRLMSVANNSGIVGRKGKKVKGITKTSNGKWRARIMVNRRDYLGEARACPLIAHIDYLDMIPANR